MKTTGNVVLPRVIVAIFLICIVEAGATPLPIPAWTTSGLARRRRRRPAAASSSLETERSSVESSIEPFKSSSVRDTLGRMALSSVETLARMGTTVTASFDELESNNISSTNGSHGLSRSEYMDWQRHILREVREESVRLSSAPWDPQDKDNSATAYVAIEDFNNDRQSLRTPYSSPNRVISRRSDRTSLRLELSDKKEDYIDHRDVIDSTPTSTLLATRLPSNNLVENNSRNRTRRKRDILRRWKEYSAKIIGYNSNNLEYNPDAFENNNNKKKPTIITTALRTLEQDMSLLDELCALTPQLSVPELGLLIGAVVASGIGPIVFPGTSVTEVLAPAAAAFTASITIGSEYIGRVAVADGKEIAANTIQCAAEAEALLANAERVKAITPLCVGVGATCASFALLTPTLIEVLNIGNSVQMVTELYLLCPLVSVLAAAVANLALEETRGFATRAINVGVRRFAKGGNVGRTWLSSSEQVQRNSKAKTNRWWSFAGSVLPAPILGSIFGPPALSTKCIIVAALAAAQSAYFLALAESVLARAQDAVALKARSAAVCDTYANQGSRNSAILPFTSALSAFCAAATAAIVELPFIDTVSALYGTAGEVVLVSIFPILSSTFAAAASVSKARCEVDAEAACQAASTLALEYDSMNGSGDDPVLRPFLAVAELIRLAVSSGWRSLQVGIVDPVKNVWRFSFRKIRMIQNRFRWKVGKNKNGVVFEQ